MIIGLRVKAQAIPVPTPIESVDAASHIAWVSELRKSSTAQTQSIPAASAARACSARSPTELPRPAIWIRSSAAGAAHATRQRTVAAALLEPVSWAIWLASLRGSARSRRGRT